MKKIKKFFWSMLSTLIFAMLCTHCYSNVMLDISYKSWSRAFLGGIGFLFCLAIAVISFGVMCYTIEHSKIFSVVTKFLKRELKACIAIVAVIIFISLLENALTAGILKLTTLRALSIYVIEFVSFITAICFWPAKNRLPDAE